MFKIAYNQRSLSYRQAPLPEESKAASWLSKVAKTEFERNLTARIAIDPKSHYYLDSWAVSAYEKFGLNENADGFEREHLKEAYRTFTGSWVCLDHENWDPTLAVGSNVDAVYMPDDYVRVAMAVDRKRSEARRPGLEQSISSGLVTDTSMGVYASHSMCTVCANIASDEHEFCDHVRLPIRGTILCNAETKFKKIRAGECNRGLIFFENTIITSDEGADKNAKILSKLAAVNGKPKKEIEAILRAIRDVSKETNSAGNAVLARLVHRLNQELRSSALS